MPSHPLLSVVLPVHNGEKLLTQKVTKLLDILPDLTSCFEILVVDDGSTDHTAEVAYELAREYPQISVAIHDERRGSTGIVETALACTRADVLFVQDEHAPIDSSKFHRLWSVRANSETAIPWRRFRSKPAVLKQLAAWGVRLEDAHSQSSGGGLQMIRRPLHTATDHYSHSHKNARPTLAPKSANVGKSGRVDQHAFL